MITKLKYKNQLYRGFHQIVSAMQSKNVERLDTCHTQFTFFVYVTGSSLNPHNLSQSRNWKWNQEGFVRSKSSPNWVLQSKTANHGLHLIKKRIYEIPSSLSLRNFPNLITPFQSTAALLSEPRMRKSDNDPPPFGIVGTSHCPPFVLGIFLIDEKSTEVDE